MKKIKSIFIGLSAVLLLGSCDLLDVKPNIITEKTFYTSSSQAQLALNGVYGVLNSWQLYGCNLILDLNYNSDIVQYMSTTNASMKGASFELDANSDDVYQTWTWLYKGIRNANAFLENIEGTDFDPDGKMEAQARFLRAYYYFILAQNWINVPLRLKTIDSYNDVKCQATPQLKVMQFAVSEMEKSLETITDELTYSPSDVTKTTVEGILARVYLYMAGEAVSGTTAEQKHEYFGKAADYARMVIESGKHELNPDYSQIFINMIGDKYDKEYHESMWEADFLGDRSSPDFYGNSRWGELNGLRSSNSGTNYSEMNTNFAYGLFCNTIKLWNLYMDDDRTKLEKNLSVITDKRQLWSLPPYHYNGSGEESWLYPYGGDPSDTRKLIAGIDKTPYYTSGAAVKDRNSTNQEETYYPGSRYCGKFRREVQYEGRKNFKSIWCGINVPLLRYSDVLLMYAEAMNEYNGSPTEDLYNIILPLRERAGIASEPFAKYASYEKFQQFVRNERARELCFEGLRKFDLLRWGIYLSSMKEVAALSGTSQWNTSTARNYVTIVSRTSEKNNYMPIPSLELAVNTELKQNPLW